MNHEFTFGHGEAENFDEHIKKSIRGYDNLLQDVVNLSQYFVEQNTTVVDIGCSTGKLLQKIVAKNVIDCEYVGVEIEKNFVKYLDKTKQLVAKNNQVLGYLSHRATYGITSSQTVHWSHHFSHYSSCQ